MFKITSTRPVTWPGFALLKGDNVFPSRKSVPAELWPKLARFRDLDILAFDLEFDKDGKPVGDDSIKLDELTELQLFQMGKAELADLAKANGVTLGDDAKKAQLLEALVAKLPKRPAPEEAKAEAGPDAGAPKRSRGPATAIDVR